MYYFRKVYKSKIIELKYTHTRTNQSTFKRIIVILFYISVMKFLSEKWDMLMD